MNLTSNRFIKIYMGLLLVSPLVLLFLPADVLDSSTTQLCLSKVLFHRECIGCGISRAVMHFIHLEFKEAWYYNKLVVLVIPFLGYLWVDAFVTCLKILKENKAQNKK